MPTSEARGAFPIYRPARPRPDTVAWGYEFSAPDFRCPGCGDILIRLPRRGVDRLLSVFVPVRRFRCPNFLCVWEGNLRRSKLRIRALPHSIGLPSAAGCPRR